MGGGEFAKRLSYFNNQTLVKMMTNGGGGQKSQKIDDVFYEWSLYWNNDFKCLTKHTLVQATRLF